jgi:hypothetical protein
MVVCFSQPFALRCFGQPQQAYLSAETARRRYLWQLVRSQDFSGDYVEQFFANFVGEAMRLSLNGI